MKIHNTFYWGNKHKAYIAAQVNLAILRYDKGEGVVVDELLSDVLRIHSDIKVGGHTQNGYFELLFKGTYIGYIGMDVDIGCAVSEVDTCLLGWGVSLSQPPQFSNQPDMTRDLNITSSDLHTYHEVTSVIDQLSFQTEFSYKLHDLYVKGNSKVWTFRLVFKALTPAKDILAVINKLSALKLG